MGVSKNGVRGLNVQKHVVVVKRQEIETMNDPNMVGKKFQG